jgi:hypothetical protein
MVIDTIQLLREREIIFPCRIVSSILADREFRLTVAGYPWWRDQAGDAESQITFRFSGMGTGNLDLSSLLDYEDHEWLEEFEIDLTSTLDWADPNQFSIYCSAPLLNPVAVYLAVEDYIVASNALRTPGDYLNGANRLSTFLEIATSPGYLLATGPEPIRSIVVAELNSQSIRHTVLETKRHTQGRLLVRLQGSAFFCATALAEFESMA